MIEHILKPQPNAHQPIFSLCVYCGSRPGTSAVFEQIASTTGQLIAQHQGQLVYGGGLRGLMGSVATNAQANGAPVVGVIPSSLASVENTNHQCDELYIVENMHQRKNIMSQRADAFLILPGGIGTLDEFFEIWTWRYLGYHQAPIAVLNVDGFYSHLLEFMQQNVAHGFINQHQLDLLIIDSDIEAIFAKLLVALKLTS